jgi:hypothetical protein
MDMDVCLGYGYGYGYGYGIKMDWLSMRRFDVSESFVVSVDGRV